MTIPQIFLSQLCYIVAMKRARKFKIQNEKWKMIEGSNDSYVISNHGRVLSLCKNEPYIIKPWLSSKGYQRVNIFDQKRFVHRLVAEHFIPNPENKPQVNHKNAIKTENRVENLEWLTQDEHTEHSMKLPGSGSGERNRSSRLTAQNVILMRKLSEEGVSAMDIYRRCKESVSYGTILKVLRRESWKHLP